MLATANARYARFLAAFGQRIARVIGNNAFESRGAGHWRGEPITILYPVPGEAAVGTSVRFNAVLLPEPQKQYRVFITPPSTGHQPTGPSQPAGSIKLLMMQVRGGCYSTSFEPTVPGLYAWKLDELDAERPVVSGVLAVHPK